MKLSNLILKEKLVLHDELNSKLWKDGVLLEDVDKALKQIAEAFISSLKINKADIDDIILTGSNVNYNYVEGVSDIDIHVEVRADNYKCLDITEYFLAKKTIWNLQHDITVKGYPVELYAETAGDHSVTGAGTYSLKNNKWLVQPVKFSGDVDEPSIARKVISIKHQIDNIINTKVDDLAVLEKIKANIRNLRKSGIQSGGEFSTNNLVFKELRNDGYLEKLSSYYENLADNELSLK